MSLENSILGLPGKCGSCSKTISKKEILMCKDCSEVFCKHHIRINPKNSFSYCVRCFSEILANEVNEEMEEEFRTTKAKLQKIKKKIHLCKKENSEKVKAIDRLQKLVASYELANTKKFESLEKKIQDEQNNEIHVTRATESIVVTIEDSIKNQGIIKNKLKKTEEDYIANLTELDTIKQENNRIRLELLETTEKNKEIVPYTRLRNLGCNECRNKVKAVFPQEILNGNTGNESIYKSVMAYKNRSSTTPVSGKKKISLIKAPNDTCKCFIQ